MKYGIWDIPGRKEARHLWPIFYRYIQIDAVLVMLNVMMLVDQSVAALEEVSILS